MKITHVNSILYVVFETEQNVKYYYHCSLEKILNENFQPLLLLCPEMMKFKLSCKMLFEKYLSNNNLVNTYDAFLKEKFYKTPLEYQILLSEKFFFQDKNFESYEFQFMVWNRNFQFQNHTHVCFSEIYCENTLAFANFYFSIVLYPFCYLWMDKDKNPITLSLNFKVKENRIQSLYTVEHGNKTFVFKNVNLAIKYFAALNPVFHTKTNQGNIVTKSFAECVLDTKKTEWKQFLYFCLDPSFIICDTYRYRLLTSTINDESSSLFYPHFKNVYTHINNIASTTIHSNGLTFQDEDPICHYNSKNSQKEIINENNYCSQFFV